MMIRSMIDLIVARANYILYVSIFKLPSDKIDAERYVVNHIASSYYGLDVGLIVVCSF